MSYRYTLGRLFFAVVVGLLLISGPFGTAQHLHAQKPLPTLFDFDDFEGSGFAPGPAAGQLDSDEWRVRGLSEGDGTFGGSHPSGDFARGTSTGGVTTGGIYAFDVGGGDIILGVQPGGSDFTPGTITLSVQNNTGISISDPTVSYEIWSYNDQPRANSLNFSYSIDDINYIVAPTLNFTTTETADVSPAWQMVTRETILTGVTLADGDFLYLQWTGDDVSGSEARDEYGIDDVRVSLADVAVSKAVAPSIAAPGETLTYTLSFSNTGNDTASGVIITDAIPVSLTNVSVVSSGVSISDSGAATDFVWQVADMAPGASGIITLTGTLTNTFVTTTMVQNTATITATDDVDGSNNRGSAGVEVVAGPAAPSLPAHGRR